MTALTPENDVIGMQLHHVRARNHEVGTVRVVHDVPTRMHGNPMYTGDENRSGVGCDGGSAQQHCEDGNNSDAFTERVHG